jgi:hypothetical protein
MSVREKREDEDELTSVSRDQGMLDMFRRGPDIKDDLEERVEGCASKSLDKYTFELGRG